MTYNKIFIQPGFGSTTQFFDISLSPRIALVFTETHSPTLFLEPIFASKLGFKYIFLTSQFGLSFPIAKNEEIFVYQPLIFNIGILFKFGKIYDENSSF